MPSTALAMWLKVPLDWIFRINVALAAAASAGYFSWSTRSRNGFPGSVVLCATAGACLLILPSREFGQREHLLLIAVFPYLALSSQRLASERSVGFFAALMIGMIAGLGIALKPYFLAVPLLVEIVVQVLGRRRVALFRAENVAIGLVFLAYGLSLLFLGQAYLHQVVPLAHDIYWSFDLPFVQLLPAVLPSLVFITLAAFYQCMPKTAWRSCLAPLQTGLAVSYFVQHKGYPYHVLPIIILALVMAARLATITGGLFARRGSGRACVDVRRQRHASIWLVERRIGSMAVVRSRSTGCGNRSLRMHQMAASCWSRCIHIRRSPSPFTRQPSTFADEQPLVPSGSRAQSHGPPPCRVGGVDRAQCTRIHPSRPCCEGLDLVIIDTNSARHTANPATFDFLAFYLEDPAFRQAWSSYREIERLGAYRQFARIAKSSPRPNGRPST